MRHVAHVLISLLWLAAASAFINSNGLSARSRRVQQQETQSKKEVATASTNRNDILEHARQAIVHESPQLQKTSTSASASTTTNRIKKAVLSSAMAMSMWSSAIPANHEAAVAAGVTTVELEAAITSLESASDRKDTVQALADLFEAAGSKTLLVRTKYKYRIIKAVNEKHVALSNEWDNVLGYESGELKRRVDPFRTVDLKSYLQVAPFVGGAAYLGALFVQQALPELFVFAYPAAVLVLVAPAAFIVLFS